MVAADTRLPSKRKPSLLPWRLSPLGLLTNDVARIPTHSRETEHSPSRWENSTTFSGFPRSFVSSYGRWMALHPWGAKRGVQYLSLFKSTGDRKSPLLDLAVPNRRFSEYEKKYEPFLLNIEYRVAAPRVSAHGNHAHRPEYSWLKDNRSLYAWGAGLSSACRESRWIFRESRRHPDGRVIKRRKTRKTRKTQFDRDLGRLENRSRKLFCLEFEREDIQASMTISWGVLLRQLPLSPGNSSPFNIAFEFHPSWVTSLPDEREPFDLHQEPSPRGLVARIFEAWCRREIDSHVTVWLIDRSIRVGRGSGVRFYSSSVFADLQHTYVAFESRDVFYGAGKTKRERDTAFYLCKRLNIRKRSIRKAPRRSCLRVLACMPTDEYRRNEERRKRHRVFPM